MQSAYAGIRKNLTEATLLPWRQGLPRVALDDFFHEKGYYPGQPHYAITSPVFERTTITLPSGKKFAIIAKGASNQRKYIQKAYLNGRELNAPFITHHDVVSGGKLELVLADLPNREWGSKAAVPQ